MAVSDDALQQNEGSRAARPEPLPFLLFMCPVATTSATHQAHKFSSLLPHIDLTTASSKEPMNHFSSGTHTFEARVTIQGDDSAPWVPCVPHVASPIFDGPLH